MDLQTKLKREDEEPWVDMQFSQVLLNSFISTIHFIILYLLLVVFSLFLRRAIASTIWLTQCKKNIFHVSDSMSESMWILF